MARKKSTGYKLSDEAFLSILRENAGIYARTARAIRKQFNIDYSRQAVKAKAENFPKELADIKEENLDVAEEGLMTLMRSKNERVRLRAIEYFLDRLGKMRGYTAKGELDITSNGQQIQINPISFVKQDGSE